MTLEVRVNFQNELREAGAKEVLREKGDKGINSWEDSGESTEEKGAST